MAGKWTQFICGIATGAVLAGGITMATQAAAGIYGVPSNQPIYVNGQRVTMTAYNIGNNNYVKLRDIGKVLDFNVYWKNGVQVDTNSPYTGVEPEVEIPDNPTPTAEKPNLSASGTKPSSGTFGAAKETTSVEDAVRQDIIRRTNDLRQENGLPVLEEDALLSQAAQVRAEEMAATSVYSHLRPDGSKRTTVTDCIYTSENIHCILSRQLKGDPATGVGKLAVDGWAASETHLNGMLDDQRCAIGVGVAKGISPTSGEECWYCVQWFLRTGYTVTWVDTPLTQR